MCKRLNKKIAYKKLQKFFDENPMVLFGTGTSCAIDTKYGMPALRDHLLEEIPKLKITDSQSKEWDELNNALEDGDDFEKAMDLIRDEKLLNNIIKRTAKFIIGLDQKYTYDIFTGEKTWPAFGLFKRLVDGLQGADIKLHVATTNYDLLAEHAFEKNKLPYLTGFVGGICRHLDWKTSERGITYAENVQKGSKIQKITKLLKHIRLYKVHGSLNRFKLNGIHVENNRWTCEVPEGVKRVMITPGKGKNEQLHESRNDLLGPFDDAVKDHRAFLFLGFGFNDSQLCNDTLKAKLIKKKCQGLIITRDSNERIENLLKESDNLWLVCKNENDDSTRI